MDIFAALKAEESTVQQQLDTVHAVKEESKSSDAKEQGCVRYLEDV
jgi:hypothetical protein